MTMTKQQLLEVGRVLRPLEVGRFDKGTVAQKCGLSTGIITIDVDHRRDPSMEEFAHRRTPRGYHIDVVATPQLTNRNLREGIDVLAEGRCAVVLGSKEGKPYEWLRDPRPYLISELPLWLQEALA